jgi:hypothetical protein
MNLGRSVLESEIEWKILGNKTSILFTLGWIWPTQRNLGKNKPTMQIGPKLVGPNRLARLVPIHRTGEAGAQAAGRQREVQREWRKRWRRSARCEWGKISWLQQNPSWADKDDSGERAQVGGGGTVAARRLSVRAQVGTCLPRSARRERAWRTGDLSRWADCSCRPDCWSGPRPIKTFYKYSVIFQLFQMLEAQKYKTWSSYC